MELMFQLESGTGGPIRSTLHWHCDDPYAVILTMGVGDRAPQWEFALSLISDALGAPGSGFGDGDVKVRVIGQILYLMLSPPGEFAMLSCPADLLRKFVDAVQRQNADADRTTDEQLDWFLQELRGEIQP